MNSRPQLPSGVSVFICRYIGWLVLGVVTLSGVETLLFPSIHCPVITDPPLLSRNPFNLAVYS